MTLFYFYQELTRVLLLDVRSHGVQHSTLLGKDFWSCVHVCVCVLVCKCVCVCVWSYMNTMDMTPELMGVNVCL